MCKKILRTCVKSIINLQILVRSFKVLSVFQKEINFMVFINDLYVKNAQNYCYSHWISANFLENFQGFINSQMRFMVPTSLCYKPLELKLGHKKICMFSLKLSMWYHFQVVISQFPLMCKKIPLSSDFTVLTNMCKKIPWTCVKVIKNLQILVRSFRVLLVFRRD